MPDFTGVVRVLNTDSGQATIQLDGGGDESGGNLQLGGGGQDGDLTLNDSQGSQRIFASASQPFLRFEQGGRITLTLDGSRGDISLIGDVTLAGADCAEEFHLADGARAEPGSVLVIDDEETLAPCESGYDRRVAGIISGAGHYRPGIVLDGQGTPGRGRVAMVGKVFCRVDATYGPIGIGELLTTSPTRGHAMAARDRSRTPGAVLGKALRACAQGTGLIPVLVALQ